MTTATIEQRLRAVEHAVEAYGTRSARQRGVIPGYPDPVTKQVLTTARVIWAVRKTIRDEDLQDVLGACPRCHGTGQYGAAGACFRCGGAGRS